MEVMTKVASGMKLHALAFLAMLIILLLLNTCCNASVIVKTNNNSFQCSDRLDECLFEEETLDLELKFLMNPYISRMLADGTIDIHSTNDGGKPAIPCGKNGDKPVDKCIPKGGNVNPHSCTSQNYYHKCGSP